MIRFKAKIFKDGESYSVEFPDLKGCFSVGHTIEEARSNAVEALDLYLEEANNPFWPLPKAKDYKGKNFYWITPSPEILVPLTIREARRALKLSQKQAAEKLNMKLQAYQKLEYPRKSNPTAKTLFHLASVLKMKFDLSA